jgi:predicted aspartyl protease
VVIEYRTLAGYRSREFLVDTGADLSVVPRRLAQEVGHHWDTLPVLAVAGVGQGRVHARLGTLPIRIGHLDLSVRCLFLDQPVAPFILGCTDVLDRFALTIDAGQGKIVFTELPCTMPMKTQGSCYQGSAASDSTVGSVARRFSNRPTDCPCSRRERLSAEAT